MTIPCAQCGRAAVEISLLPPIPGSKELWHDRERLERTEFLGKVIRFGSLAQLTDLFEAIQRGDYITARQLDLDFVAFECEKCGQVYCDTCWQLESAEYDEGFYDSTHATCPHGHRQMVDD
jgi:hypothetical protein